MTTRARKNEIAGWREDTLLVRVKAPPVEGKANAAVRRLLADALDLRIGEIRIAAGEASRDKLVELPAAALGKLKASP